MASSPQPLGVWTTLRLRGVPPLRVFVVPQTTVGALKRWCEDSWYVPADRVHLEHNGRPLKSRVLVMDWCGLSVDQGTVPGVPPPVIEATVLASSSPSAATRGNPSKTSSSSRSSKSPGGKSRGGGSGARGKRRARPGGLVFSNQMPRPGSAPLQSPLQSPPPQSPSPQSSPIRRAAARSSPGASLAAPPAEPENSTPGGKLRHLRSVLRHQEDLLDALERSCSSSAAAASPSSRSSSSLLGGHATSSSSPLPRSVLKSPTSHQSGVAALSSSHQVVSMSRPASSSSSASALRALRKSVQDSSTSKY